MKNFIKLILLLVCSTVTVSQTQAQIKYPHGIATSITVTDTAGTIALTQAWNTMTFYTFTSNNDDITALTITANSGIMKGSRVVVVLPSTGNYRNINWSTGFRGINDSVATSKTGFFEFIYDGTVFRQTNKNGLSN